MTGKIARRTTGPDADTVERVWNRDGGACVRCGVLLPWSQRGYRWSVQHRKPRGQGGGNSCSNLILLCGSGTTGCHGWVEEDGRAESYLTGWLVHMNHDPAKMPVLVNSLQGRVLLTDGGEYAENPDGVA